MNGWTTARLGDIVSIVGGGTPTRTNPNYYGGKIPWVTPKDMKSHYVNKSLVTLTQSGLDNSAARLVPANSILIVVRSGVLKHTVPVGINTVPVAINQDMKSLLCSQRIDPRFLARFVKARSTEVLQWVRATTADNFPIDKLRELNVPVPPISEQLRIAEILERADTLGVKRRETIAQLDRLAQAIFIDMFSEIEFPDGISATVAGIAHADKGSIRTGPFGSQLLHSEFVDSGVAVLGIDNVVANEFRWAGRRYITETKYKELGRYTVRPGDVLITIMGTCGRCAVVPEEIPLAINTKHLCCITLDQKKCLPVFLHAYFLRHPLARRYLNRAAKGAIMSGLNMGIIKAMPISLPPLALQHEFARRVEAIDTLRVSQQAHLAELDALFASLEYRAFRGEL